MRSGIAASGAVAIALLVSEFAMRPEMGTRLGLAVYLSATAVLAGGVTWLIRRWVRHGAPLSRTITALALLSIGVIAGSVTAASALMFISSHDLQLLWILLGFALFIALVSATSILASLTSDLRRIADVARRVGDGDLTARTGIEREDEVGAMARTIDTTAARLAAVEGERVRDREARHRLLTAIGHDLRTPLAALQAAVEAMQDDVAEDPARYLAAMEGDVRALTGLVDDLFVLTRLQSGLLELELEPVDLSDVADETIEALHPIARARGVELELRTSGHVSARGSVAELGRVIRNLVDNAIRHSPRHGRVVVEVTEGDAAVLSVIDDGPGFRAGFVDSAFDGFSRDDDARTGGGAGLGLAIAKGFIAAFGGSIWAEPGPGGRVAFRLPSGKADPDAAAGRVVARPA